MALVTDWTVSTGGRKGAAEMMDVKKIAEEIM